METIKQRLLSALAATYERSGAGRTGVAARPVTVIYRELLAAAKCNRDHTEITVAEQQLRALENRGFLSLRTVRRDASVIEKVELHLSREEEFYRELGALSPTQRRQNLSKIFESATDFPVPDEHREGWRKMCARMAVAAKEGKSIAPFLREDDAATEELLRASSQILGWKAESLLRFASCQVFGDSKTLGLLAAPIESVIAIASGGAITNLAQVGILENPRSCHLSGPAILYFPEGTVDLRPLRAPLMLSKVDLERCLRIETMAHRFCTVENPTTFHELAKLRDETLLACTDGYAGSALLILMSLLPDLRKYHFGDSDPAGFDILADLRWRSGMSVESIHMRFRPTKKKEPLAPKDIQIVERLLRSTNLSDSEKSQLRDMLVRGDKGLFEQEMLGAPCSGTWPYYP